MAVEMDITVAPVTKFEDRVPCNWNLTMDNEDGVTLVAVNHTSGENFIGTLEEFNAAMKA